MAEETLRRSNAELVRRFIEAINDDWNIAAMDALVSEDFRFTIPFAPDWFQVHCDGKEEALAFLDSVRELMEPENLHDLMIDTLAGDPGEVIAEYKSDTRIRATSLPYHNLYVSRFTVRDGKITRFAEHLDPIRFVIAIGGKVDPPPGFISAAG
ncbi:nuclear transport factor 2 family protein [Sphingosinicella sp.]|uniref:nuclear transport factor 2 family protein n=1 Tax=Sphingosinicella sp. TaxID=1917971 RepID=UPI0040378F51